MGSNYFLSVRGMDDYLLTNTRHLASMGFLRSSFSSLSSVRGKRGSEKVCFCLSLYMLFINN
jgi:hypothetical protein